MAKKFAPIVPTLAHVRCAVSMRKGTLEEALEIMDRPDDDVGSMLMRAQIDVLAKVLKVIDGTVEW